MLNRKITGVLLASSMLIAVQAGPVYAGARDKAADVDPAVLISYEADTGLQSVTTDGAGLIDSIEQWQEETRSEVASLQEKGRLAANAAEAAAEKARSIAEETEGAEIEEAAETANEHAENARAAAELAGNADDVRTAEMGLKLAEAARAAAEEACADAGEAAEAEEAAREEEMLASAEYLGTFKLTAYCNCARCCGTAGNATASGVMPTSGHTVAMGGIEFGTKLLINGTVYTVEDRGTPYGHVDIFMDSHEEALQFGMGSADVYLIKE